ncbi:MAG: glycosyltransferase [Syntrophomonas sp.]|nr:glycosyltransferase [Syntrophomonas sp.]
MKNSPLVSVIIPAYNHELYIEEALQSVVNQTYNNIELIVINDGSKDGTAKVITEFISRNQHYNIKYISKTNEGICRTLNKGLEIAKGSYFALLASDDMWTPERIEKQVYFMERNQNIGLVFSDHYFIRFTELTQIKATDYKPNIRKCFKNGIQNINIYEKLLTEDIIPALTVLIRKECFDKVGGFDNNLKAEDYDMWLRISKEFPIAFIDEPLAYYRVHDTNVSNKTMSLDTLKTVRAIMQKQYNDPPLKHQYIKKTILFIKFWYTVIRNRVIRVFVIEKK